MRKMRAGTIHKKSNVAMVAAMHESISRLAPEPVLAHSMNVGIHSPRQAKAVVLLNHLAVIQVGNRHLAAGTGIHFLPRVEVRERPIANRHLEVPPPLRWGINE